MPFVEMKVSGTVALDDAEGWVSHHLLARSGASRKSLRTASHLVGVAVGAAEACFPRESVAADERCESIGCLR